jgi:hypothetical protein
MNMNEWVKFRTIQCGTGSIDVWTGDCINNPNNTTKNKMQLNSVTQYFRLNGKGDWISYREFDGNLISWITVNPTESAEDIWNAALRREEGN